MGIWTEQLFAITFFLYVQLFLHLPILIENMYLSIQA